MLNIGKRVFLIRHGEALHNINFSLFGKDAYFHKDNTDAELTDQGKLQATNLGRKWFNKSEIDLILVSPLTRTLQTANGIFADMPKLPMVAIDSIKEFPQGKHTPNIRKTKKELKEYWTNVDFDLVEPYDSFLGKEETEEQLDTRIKKTKEYISFLGKNYKNIALVSHSTFITKFIGNELEDENSYGIIEHCWPYPIELPHRT